MFNNRWKHFFLTQALNQYKEILVCFTRIWPLKNNALEEFKPDVIYVHTSFKNLKFSPKLSSSTLEVEQSFKNELERFEDMGIY